MALLQTASLCCLVKTRGTLSAEPPSWRSNGLPARGCQRLSALPSAGQIKVALVSQQWPGPIRTHPITSLFLHGLHSRLCPLSSLEHVNIKKRDHLQVDVDYSPPTPQPPTPPLPPPPRQAGTYFGQLEQDGAVSSAALRGEGGGAIICPPSLHPPTHQSTRPTALWGGGGGVVLGDASWV